MNYRLPASDYRVLYGARSSHVEVVFGLPERPVGLPDDRYRAVRVGEGLSVRHLAGLLALGRLLRRERHQLAGAHFFSSQLFLAGPILARLAGVSCVITVTGFGRTVSEPRYRFLRSVFWLAFRHALSYSRAVLFQNRHDHDMTAKRYPKLAHKFRYFPSAVEFPAHERSFHSQPLGILLVARLSEGKGVEDFLELASRLHSDRVVFTLVGPPAFSFKGLAERVERAHRAGEIEYLGPLYGDDLVSVFSQHHVFLFPSRAEGLARVMLEAGFSGLCPVAYDIPGNRDLVPSRDDYLVPPFDREKLASAVVALEADRDELARLATAYQAWVTDGFRVESYVEAMDDLLASVGMV